MNGILVSLALVLVATTTQKKKISSFNGSW